MNQLVELGKNKEKFSAAKTEVIAVFREEKKGEEGLEAIKEKTKTTFQLALDYGKEHTGRYSAGKGEFTGYVINASGVITKIIKGDLRNRAKSAELLEAISSAAGSGSKSGSSSKQGSEKKDGSESKPAGSDNKTGSEKK